MTENGGNKNDRTGGWGAGSPTQVGTEEPKAFPRPSLAHVAAVVLVVAVVASLGVAVSRGLSNHPVGALAAPAPSKSAYVYVPPPPPKVKMLPTPQAPPQISQTTTSGTTATSHTTVPTVPMTPLPIQTPSAYNNSAAHALACLQEKQKIQGYILADEQLKAQLIAKASAIFDDYENRGMLGSSMYQEAMKANQQDINKVVANENFWKSYKIPGCK